MVGYDAAAGLVYVAVVVRDDENSLIDDVNRTDDLVCLETAAVEIFIAGALSERTLARQDDARFADRLMRLDAARMPALQYVGVPDRLARLRPGGRLGLDVAILDKDRASRLAYLTWAPASPYFKGYNAGTLGELILADGPSEAVEGTSPEGGSGGAGSTNAGSRSPD